MSRREEPFARFPKCSVTRHDTVVTIEGEIDCATAASVEAELCAVMPNGNVGFLVDLTSVTFLGAAGLRVFAKSDGELRQRGGQLEILCPNRCQRNMFTITGLDQTLIVYDEFGHTRRRSRQSMVTW